MSEENYQQVRQKLQECFEKDELDQGLKIAIEIKEKFPDHASTAYFNVAFFQALLKLTEDTVETLEEGYEKGFWWAESQLRLFPNYALLSENEKFNTIVAKYFDRYKKIRSDNPFKWVVCTPANYDSSRNYPVLFALHQGASNIEETEQMWKSVLRHEVLLALPQSSEIIEPNKFTWIDIDSGLKELNEVYTQVIANYPIDLDHVVLAGSSIGGTLALEATFIRPQFPVKGCIVVNPAFVKPDVISQHLERAKRDNVQCGIIVGAKDPEYEHIKELAIVLNRSEIDIKLYKILGLGHAFPDNFNDLLEEMMEFLALY